MKQWIVTFLADADPSPEWLVLLFLLIPIAAGVSAWRGFRGQKKREAMPHTMSDDQYHRYNRERFNGK